MPKVFLMPYFPHTAGMPRRFCREPDKTFLCGDPTAQWDAIDAKQYSRWISYFSLDCSQSCPCEVGFFLLSHMPGLAPRFEAVMSCRDVQDDVGCNANTREYFVRLHQFDVCLSRTFGLNPETNKDYQATKVR